MHEYINPQQQGRSKYARIFSIGVIPVFCQTVLFMVGLTGLSDAAITQVFQGSRSTIVTRWIDAAGGSVELQTFNAFSADAPFYDDPVNVEDQFTLSMRKLTVRPGDQDGFNKVDTPVPWHSAVDGPGVIAITDTQTILVFDFLFPITAFALDPRHFDYLQTTVYFLFDDGSIDSGVPLTDRFWGVTADREFSRVEIRTTVDPFRAGDDSDSFGFDNVRFAKGVPEPSTSLLLALTATLSLFARSRKRFI